MNEQIYETDTHEQRQLKDFNINDYIVIRGTEYRVLMLAHKDGFVSMLADDLHGKTEIMNEHGNLMFTARKREPNEKSI